MGCYVSFAGPVTFKKSAEIREAAALVPAERILTETDCPFMAPEPFRGRKNEPAYTVFTAARIAEARGEDPATFAAAAYANALRVLDQVRARERLGDSRRPRVLCIAGSPRRGGNSDQLLDALARGVRDAGGEPVRLVAADARRASVPWLQRLLADGGVRLARRDGRGLRRARLGGRDRDLDARLLRDGARRPQDALRPLSALLGAPLCAPRARCACAQAPRCAAGGRWGRRPVRDLLRRHAEQERHERSRRVARDRSTSASARMRPPTWGTTPRPSRVPRRSAASSSRRFTHRLTPGSETPHRIDTAPRCGLSRSPISSKRPEALTAQIGRRGSHSWRPAGLREGVS